MLVILPDTNALLHFKRPDQVDWAAVAGQSEVEIVLAPVPVHEIDKHSRQHEIGRVRDRARNLKSWIRTLLKGQPGFRIEGREPTKFLADGLDPNVPDDRLIASALMLVAEGNSVAIYTDDTLLHAKAQGRPIQMLFPPESDRLKEEPDPLRKENEELRRDIESYRARQPRLSIGWASGEHPLNIAFPGPQMGDVRHPRDERERLKPLPDPGPPPTRKDVKPSLDLAALRNFSSFGPTQGEVLAYNLALEKYHQSYQKFFDRLSRWAYIESRLVELSFVASNDGSAPASSFRAWISLPDGLKLLEDAEGIGDRPKPPSPPSKPGVLGLMEDQGARRDPFDTYSAIRGAGLVHPNNWDDSPYIEKEGSRIELRRSKLLQHNPFVFDPAYVVVGSQFDGRGGSLEVRMTAEELAQPVITSLPFRVSV